MDPVKLEDARYATGDVDRRIKPPKPITLQPRATNLVDAIFTHKRGLEVIIYDAEGVLHRCPITPAQSAALIRRLAGYLATHHGSAT
jgi:hypothetical protein